MATESYVLYMHTFPNKKVYIGITKNTPVRRWNNGQGYRRCRLMWRAIQKYGWENVEHTIILSGLSYSEACEKEQEYISRYKSNDKNFGYNIENGGNAQEKISDEVKRKMSQVKKEKCKDASYVESLKRNLLQKKNFKLSDETKRKIGSKNRVSHSRPIGRFDLNGDLVAVYSSASEASRKLGISKSCICRVAKGERKVSLKSTWKYLSGGEDLLQLN